MSQADSEHNPPLSIFASVPRRFRSFVIRDDGFAPQLRCGEFAVIDTTLCDPVDGEFVLYRSEHHEAVVRLRLPDQRRYAGQKAVNSGHPLPWWMLLCGRCRVVPVTGRLSPEDEKWAPGGLAMMADGPISEQNLRPLIAGRVVGVVRAISQETLQ